MVGCSRTKRTEGVDQRMWWFRRKRSQTPAAATPLASVSQYRTHDGRLFLADDPYPLPKDFAEVNRLDFQHYMLRYALPGNYLAPIIPQQIQDVLDIGAGTGRWAREVAEQLPHANVIALDRVATNLVSAEMPPPNFVFVEGNLLTGLPFPDHSFDFVHQRLLYSAIPAQQWPFVLHEIVRVTRPGGWIELVEAATLENRSPIADQLNDWVVEACSRRGLDMTIAPHLGDMLHAAGIPNTATRKITLPIGAYGGRLGTMLEKDILAIYQGSSALVVGAGLATQETYLQAVQQWEQDVTHYQMAFPFYVIDGQKQR